MIYFGKMGLIERLQINSYGTSLAENTMVDRAKEVEQYIPEKYLTEIKGLAAGSGIDYDYILMLNTAATTGWKHFSCTSVAVKMQDGKIIRSRSYETLFGQLLKPHILFINQPSQGYAFASLFVPGIIGVFTAMNETGLNFGPHGIIKAPTDWKGFPNEILNRQIIENADSVEE